jgi:P-type Ca2+ transporter type 2C
MDWHTTSTADVLTELNTSIERGLTQSEADQRLQKVGLNELVDRGTQNPWKILFDQFKSVMVLILIAAAVISLLVGDVKDAIAILAIVVLFGVLGFTQEYRAEKAMAALRKLAVPNVRVRRDGELREVAASQLVPGDIVLLEAGNVVPADALEKLEITSRRVPLEVNPATSHLYIVNPLHGGLAGLFSTHPSTQERVTRLRAMTSLELAKA